VTDETETSFKELQAKYQLLLAENRFLKADLDAFKSGRSVTELQRHEEPCLSWEPEQIIQHPATELPTTNISKKSESAEKISLFMSLFNGRDDVYAKRWDSKNN
jgi:hypothetical protein